MSLVVVFLLFLCPSLFVVLVVLFVLLVSSVFPHVRQFGSTCLLVLFVSIDALCICWLFSICLVCFTRFAECCRRCSDSHPLVSLVSLVSPNVSVGVTIYIYLLVGCCLLVLLVLCVPLDVLCSCPLLPMCLLILRVSFKLQVLVVCCLYVFLLLSVFLNVPTGVVICICLLVGCCPFVLSVLLVSSDVLCI